MFSKTWPILQDEKRLAIFREGAERAEKAIAKLWQNGSPIVIHNDLHSGNMKRQGEKLALFDFEDISWGFPGQDIGTAMYHNRFEDNYPELLAAFRKGYEQYAPWPLDSFRELDDLIIARASMFANYVLGFDINIDKFIPLFAERIEKLLWESN